MQATDDERASGRRRLVSWLLLTVLALAALASLGGGALLSAERHGLIVLRRVPPVRVFAWVECGEIAVAIVNADIAGGAFRPAPLYEDAAVAIPWARPAIWVPARSIVVVRRAPREPHAVEARVRGVNRGLLPPVADRFGTLIWPDAALKGQATFVPRGEPVRVEIAPVTTTVLLAGLEHGLRPARTADVLDWKGSSWHT